MFAKYKENPLKNVYNTFVDEFTTDKDKVKMDHVLEAILLENGCEFSNKSCMSEYYEIIKDDFYIVFIYNAKANESNDYYDYVQFFGMKYLVIFADYFDFVIDKKDDDILGNSLYYNAIKNIIDICVYVINNGPYPSFLTRTAFYLTDINNRSILAVHILNTIVPVDSNDIDDIDDETIKLILSKNINLQLNGIRNIDL